MPDPFPQHFSTSLSQTYSPGARVEIPLRPELRGGRSLEFDGDMRSWAPEHMLLASLGLSMVTTFEMFAVRDGIEILTCDAKIGGTVEQMPEGLMFTSIVLELDLALAGNVEAVEDTLEDAKCYCVVLNSLRVPVVIETQLHTPDDPHERSAERRAMVPGSTHGQHHVS